MAKARAKAPSLRSLLTAGKSRQAKGVIRSRVRRVSRALGVSSANVSPEQKAIYHSVTGAGLSRVIRDFFDLGPADEAFVVAFLTQRVDRRLTGAAAGLRA